MARDLTLSIDVGTGSVRAALVDRSGAILHIAAREHDQIVPQFGWAEQRPLDWWAGVSRLDPRRAWRSRRRGASVSPPCALAGRCTGRCWSTKPAGRRATPRRCGTTSAPPQLSLTSNVSTARPHIWPRAAIRPRRRGPASSWHGSRRTTARLIDAARSVLMPKDYINLRLTGESAMDSGDASCSFLMAPRERSWSLTMIELLGLDAAKLPPIREPLEILGAVTPEAAAETGLREGTPVLVGGADYPVALLGSGACRPGLASDVTGTSCILTLIADAPLLDPEICNVATVEGHWGAFVLLETGGDAMRWARRAFHEKALSYDEITARAAAAPAGLRRPVLHALSDRRAARRASQRARAVLRSWRVARARASPPRRARRRRLRRSASPAHHGESGRPQDRTRHRLRRRRQDERCG